MRKQIDHFLLGLLWLLAMTLGASFLFNTKFGFNIFDIKHWAYLGQLQASRAPINVWFYIYMIIIVVVMVFGLYMMVRPRLRKILLKKESVASAPPVIAPIPATPAPIVVAAQPVAETPTAVLTRPPRLNLPNGGATIPAQKPVMVEAPVAAPAPAPVVSPDEFIEIEDIFTANGYTLKKPPQIGNIRPALFAVGPDEVLWLGAVGIEPATLAKSIDMLRTIFNDTLEDIPIHINAFMINPGGEEVPDISYFKSAEQLAAHMESHKANTNSDPENFEAYSEYIDTVSGYFNKL